mmetsp:Transcript_22259/g.69084  ORF Transcript_22259/g.69084 Transcript_22259/m.69084 type:complete len:86 (+) Transcript_22259:682-939(+)
MRYCHSVAAATSGGGETTRVTAIMNGHAKLSICAVAMETNQHDEHEEEEGKHNRGQTKIRTLQVVPCGRVGGRYHNAKDTVMLWN